MKSNIRAEAEAGLETALTTLRTGGTRFNTFTAVTSFLTAEIEHKSLRKSQLKNSSARQVSSTKSGKGNGGEKSPRQKKGIKIFHVKLLKGRKCTEGTTQWISLGIYLLHSKSQ